MDSSFFVNFLDDGQEDHEAAVAWMHAHSEVELATPAICAFEVLSGSARRGEARFERVAGFLRTLTVLELGLDAVVAAGDLDGRLHADGTPLGARETLVALPA